MLSAPFGHFGGYAARVIKEKQGFRDTGKTEITNKMKNAYACMFIVLLLMLPPCTHAIIHM